MSRTVQSPVIWQCGHPRHVTNKQLRIDLTNGQNACRADTKTEQRLYNVVNKMASYCKHRQASKQMCMTVFQELFPNPSSALTPALLPLPNRARPRPIVVLHRWRGGRANLLLHSFLEKGRKWWRQGSKWQPFIL